MIRLAAPVVLAELGWMTMGMVDTLMVGRLGPEAIGAVGVGSSLFMGVVIFAMGLMLGLDTLVSHAFGAGEVDDCHRWLVHGALLAIVLSLPHVLALTRPYLDAVTWSVPPLLMYSAFRRYLQGMGVVQPIMIALVLANIVNVVFNWILIFGNLGAPAMGVRGSAWATVLARVMMAAMLFAVIVRRERGRRPGLFETTPKIEWTWIRRLIDLGLPAATQITLEVGVFLLSRSRHTRLPSTSQRSRSWFRWGSRQRAPFASARRSAGGTSPARRVRAGPRCSSL
jgi:MATE family multidrug resistance protein